MLLLASFRFGSLGAWQCLIMLGVVLSLFPSVGLFAIFAVFAAIGVMVDVITWPPVQTSDRFIKVPIRLPSIVLPVMCINTQGFVMPRQVVGAPNGFIVKHVEVVVKWIIMDEFDLNIMFTVGK